MRGNITRRGKSSWRIKFDLGRDPLTGDRQTRLVTVRGKHQDAEKELTRLLTAADAGTLVEPSKVTIADYLRGWLNGPTGLSGKTLERYKALAEQQIIPHLGAIPIQKLKPANVQDWHSTLLRRGGKAGKPLSARTVGHAHRVLHRALERAVKARTVSRNVAHVIEGTEIESLTTGQMSEVLSKLNGRSIFPLVALALSTGMRRGELLALRWSDVDLEGAEWRRAVKALKLPPVMFHGLRHGHASALIASGLDVLTVSRRLGHGSPTITLTTYAHLFEKTDAVAAKAIEAALRTTVER